MKQWYDFLLLQPQELLSQVLSRRSDFGRAEGCAASNPPTLTGEAVTIDIGAANCVHPRNKQDVGYRLALNALNKVYGKNVLYWDGLRSMNVDNGKVILDFDHVGSGLMAKNKYGYLQGSPSRTR